MPPYCWNSNFKDTQAIDKTAMGGQTLRREASAASIEEGKPYLFPQPYNYKVTYASTLSHRHPDSLL